MKAELDRATIAGVFDFLCQSGDLKDTPRSGFTNAGAQESAAEHSWRLALMVIALEPCLEGLDIARMLKMAILHDLGEAVTGDVPAIHQSGDPEIRRMAERDAVAMLSESLPDSVGGSVKAIAAEYDAGESREAAMMKGLDKLETIFQHATGQNPPDFDYAFNLDYGAGWTRDDALLAKLRRYVDSLTRARMAEAEGPES
jgi:putative hydrolases of HD superfamily